jgi:pimeloyl-ACP methyl ester carboxylesterase
MPAATDLIRKFETASLPELLEAIRRPSSAEAAAFVAWLGPDRYKALRRSSLETGTRRRTRSGARPNVVVLHGIMGAELTVRKGRDEDLVWVNAFRLGLGQITRLKMKADGTPEQESYASGTMRKYYLEMLVGLADDANVQAFHYDWRRDLKHSADLLEECIKEWFGSSAPVLLVAHSMGGLVARTWIKHHRARWDKDCRLVMLGTPNHGSFAIPQVITGAHKMVRKLAALDQRHMLKSFTGVLNTFPGSLYMLPSPRVLPKIEGLYDAGAWGTRSISQSLLDRARKHHDLLADVIVPDRMAYIAGYHHPTADGVRDLNWDGQARLPRSRGSAARPRSGYAR